MIPASTHRLPTFQGKGYAAGHVSGWLQSCGNGCPPEKPHRRCATTTYVTSRFVLCYAA